MVAYYRASHRSVGGFPSGQTSLCGFGTVHPAHGIDRSVELAPFEESVESLRTVIRGTVYDPMRADDRMTALVDHRKPVLEKHTPAVDCMP